MNRLEIGGAARVLSFNLLSARTKNKIIFHGFFGCCSFSYKSMTKHIASQQSQITVRDSIKLYK